MSLTIQVTTKEKREYLVSNTKGGENGYTTIVRPEGTRLWFHNNTSLRDIYKALIEQDKHDLETLGWYAHPFTWSAAIEVRIIK